MLEIKRWNLKRIEQSENIGSDCLKKEERGRERRDLRWNLSWAIEWSQESYIDIRGLAK